MSVGHVARSLEETGIPTAVVGIRAFRQRMEALTLPRVVIVRHPMGRTMGAPGDEEGQRKTILRALDLLEGAEEVGTIVDLARRYRPHGCDSK